MSQSHSAIMQALTSLLPSLPASSKPFPPTLVSQSESLLSLSRQRHPNLKPEEEIARAHVCAEIASLRLRPTLRLPAIKSGNGAPCKPSTYKKLIKFLEGSLGDAVAVSSTNGGVSGASTPQGRKRNADGSVKKSGGLTAQSQRSGRAQMDHDMDVDDTPSKKRVVDRTPRTTNTTTTNTTLSKSTSRKLDFVGNVQRSTNTSHSSAAPSFVMPSIRKLSKIFSIPQVTPHVYTGTCIVLKLSQLWPPLPEFEGLDDLSTSNTVETDASLKRDISTLVLALFLLVLTRMRKGPMTTTLYGRVSQRGMHVFDLSDNTDAEATAEAENGEKAGNEDTLAAVEEWIGKLNAEGWCNGQDWWESVPEDILILDERGGSAADDDNEDNIEEADQDYDNDGRLDRRRKNNETRNRRAELEKVDPEGVLLSGLGTMLHERNDWMSEDKQLQFEIWRDDVVKRIAEQERMETSKSRAVTTR